MGWGETPKTFWGTSQLSLGGIPVASGTGPLVLKNTEEGSGRCLSWRARAWGGVPLKGPFLLLPLFRVLPRSHDLPSAFAYAVGFI